ncbi:MAG: Flp family type IVb pilin [Henriciella sp.]|nr:Flp family type IVb pilin [Henriciella sp.]
MAIRLSSFGWRICARAAKDASGATAIEYTLVASLILVGLLGALSHVGEQHDKNYECVEHAIQGDEATDFCTGRGA